MESIEINGVNVLFPYKPYDIQINYMKAVISCLQQKSNALLESPTGTGKTLSLLCASLGWLEKEYINKQNDILNETKDHSLIDETNSSTISLNDWTTDRSLPKIIFSSRTHSQLSQACNELKNSDYNRFASVVIGSRDQLCLNPDVMYLETTSAKVQSCRHKRANNSCPYFIDYEQIVNSENDFTNNKVFDIEDLVKFGEKHTCCPYYASRSIKRKSSVIFMPYNYILDPTIRRIQSKKSNDFCNAVIIFDEGHNIEKICEQSVSIELKSQTLPVCIKHLNALLEKIKQINDQTYEGFDEQLYEELEFENVCKLKIIVCGIEKSIDELIKSTPNSTHKTEIIFELMDKIGLGFENRGIICQLIDKISKILINSKEMNSSQVFLLSTSFSTLFEFIEKLFPFSLLTTESYEEHKKSFIKNYKIFSQKGMNAWTLHLWCLSASVGTKALLELGIHNIIITSGTLAPLNSFEIEMGLEFPIKLENSHVIEENQLLIINIKNSSDGTVLNSNFGNKDNLNYYRALGNTLIELFMIVPKGVLIFFSSYTALNRSIEIWKQNNRWFIWEKLNAIKQLFVEPRNQKEFTYCVNKYKFKIDEHNSNGAAFLGVCRGKLSEGLDLANDYCRCVVMTGLPFPSTVDQCVILKKQYLNEMKSKQLSANEWYSLQMKRAVNQAIGRVVRHKYDFGAIVLCDSRFASSDFQLSKWTEKFIVKENRDYKHSFKTIQSFFSQHITKSNFLNFPSVSNESKNVTICQNISFSKESNNYSVDVLAEDNTKIDQNFVNRKNSFVEKKRNYYSIPFISPLKLHKTKKDFEKTKNLMD